MLLQTPRPVGEVVCQVAALGLILVAVGSQCAQADTISYHCSFDGSKSFEPFEVDWVISNDEVIEDGQQDDDARNIVITNDLISFQSVPQVEADSIVAVLSFKAVSINRLNGSARQHYVIYPMKDKKGKQYPGRESDVAGTCVSK